MADYTLRNAPSWVNAAAVLFRQAALRGVRSAAMRTVSHIVSDLIPRAHPMPVDRGTYRAGWRFEPTEGGWFVFNAVPHAILIEEGVRGANVKIGRTLIDALVEWIKRKRIGVRATVVQVKQVSTKSDYIDGRAVTTVSMVSKVKYTKPKDSEVRAMAWAIAREMRRKGIFNGGKGLKIWEKAEQKIPVFLVEEVTRELLKEFRE